MEIGLIGVGKMGSGILRRWINGGRKVSVFDESEESMTIAREAGATTVKTIEELVASLRTPRILWLMIPAGQPVRDTIDQLAGHLDPGDTLIDGGNSRYQDSQRHAEKLSKRGVNFLDVGVSGGVRGEQSGYALMVGGEAEVVEKIKPYFLDLCTAEGLSHVGVAGAGHFVKMVHNAIEYGMMQAIAEGFDLLKNGPYKDLAMADVAHLWSHGTIIRSYLMELAAQALEKNSNLEGIQGYVHDSGEGRWSVKTAVDYGVPFGVNSAALFTRFSSRQDDNFGNQLLAALRQEFGGHAIKTKDE